MIGAAFAPLGAPERIQVLASYDLFNPDLRRELNEVSRRSAERLGMPLGMVSIVLDSAQYYAGSYGVDGWIAAAEGTPAEWAFCAHAVLGEEQVYVVPDATVHPAHADSPLVTGEGIRAYAGVQLVGPNGQVLGMHCVVGHSATWFSEEQLDTLRVAAAETVEILDRYRLVN